MHRMIAFCGACVALAVCVRGGLAADTETKNLVAQGNIQYRQLEFAKALAKYDEAIKKDAKYDVAYNNRGLALQKLGRHDDAVAAFTAAIALDAKKPAFHLNLAKVYIITDKHAQALTELATALGLDPKLAAAVYNRVWALDDKGDFRQADQAAATLTKLDKPPAGTKMLVGIVAAHNGRPGPLAEACYDPGDLPQQLRWLTDLNRSLASGGVPGLPNAAWLDLCRALRAVAAEQLDLAETCLAKVEQAAPKSPLAPWLTAMARQAAGKTKLAAEAMKRAQPLMPTVEFPPSNDPTDLLVDGRRMTAEATGPVVLPGAHVIGMIRCAQGKFLAFSTAMRIDGTRKPVTPGDFALLPQPPGMVAVAGATFLMGTDDGEKDEGPRHTVSVQGFWLDRTEVTNAQYGLFLNALKSKNNNDAQWRHSSQSADKNHVPAYWTNKEYNKPDLPVVGVDWYDAYAYAKWAGKRLPTEAEWELAAGAAGTRMYPWGAERPDTGGKFRANYDPGVRDMDGFAKLAPAESFANGASAAGAVNLAGNVWEWVSDYYSAEYYKASPPLAPKGPDSGSSCVVRGGGWNSPEGNLRATARKGKAVSERQMDVGFRCAMDVLP
jgi:formylglycine-generating enzyme